MGKTGQLITATLAVWSCGLVVTCQAQYPLRRPAPARSAVASVGTARMRGPSPAYAPPPQEQGLFEQSPLWRIDQPLRIGPGLLAPPRGSYVRLEYLIWTVQAPGSQLLGATPPPGAHTNPDRDLDQGYQKGALFDHTFDPAVGYQVPRVITNLNTGQRQQVIGSRYVPRLSEIGLQKNNGLRLTFGIPTLEYGTFEFSGWILEQASDHYEFHPREFIPAQGVGTIPQVTNGVVHLRPHQISGPSFYPSITFDMPGGRKFLTLPFTQMNVSYQSDLFGADARYIVDALAPDGEGFKLKPLLGLKYVSFQEAMYQRGVVHLPRFPLMATSFNANTTNNYLGPTVGLRTELVHRWFVLGVEPAATLSVNIAKSSVLSKGFPNFSNPAAKAASNYFAFSPILELKTYARIKLGDSWRFNVAYNAMWIAKVFRASQAIDYGAKLQGNRLVPNIKDNRSTSGVVVDGISLGLEYVY